jgi:hypothetical protein
MPIVAEQYTFVIGADTHAATHSLALVTAATGAVIDQSVFPNTAPGLDRALTWITHRTAEQPALIVIEGVGSYGAGLAQRVADAGLLVAEPSAMPAAQRRGVGKNRCVERGPRRSLGSGGRHLPVAVATCHRPAGGIARAGRGPRADGQ